MKQSLTSLIIREMQIKTTMRYHLMPVKTAIIKNTKDNKCWWGYKKKVNPVHCWWECKLVHLLWKTVWRFLKEVKRELPYDPATPLLGIYPKKMKTGCWRDICIPMFIAALVTTAVIGKQPKYLSTGEWIKIMWDIYVYIQIHIHIYTYIVTHTQWYYSTTRKKETMPFATTWVELESIMLSEISQTEKDQYNMIPLICWL